jgi:hypothetical protein
MDHGDMACHFDLEFSPAFLDMSLHRLFGIFQTIAERRADGGLPGQRPARRRRGGFCSTLNDGDRPRRTR